MITSFLSSPDGVATVKFDDCVSILWLLGQPRLPAVPCLKTNENSARVNKLKLKFRQIKQKRTEQNGVKIQEHIRQEVLHY